MDPGISANLSANYTRYNFQAFANISGKFLEISCNMKLRNIYNPNVACSDDADVADVVAAVLMCDETSCNYILLRLMNADFDVMRFIRDARLLRNQFVSGT